MTGFIEVRTTTSTVEDARMIADTLMEKRIAACIQIIGPMESIYVWEGSRHRDDEYLLLIKTSLELYPQVRVEIEGVHPYDVPEIISMPITGSSGPYLAWMEDSLTENR